VRQLLAKHLAQAKENNGYLSVSLEAESDLVRIRTMQVKAAPRLGGFFNLYLEAVLSDDEKTPTARLPCLIRVAGPWYAGRVKGCASRSSTVDVQKFRSSRQPKPSFWSATPTQSISQFNARLSTDCASSGVLFFWLK
jgi:hypothetical protein